MEFKTILLVDDEPIILDIIARDLTSEPAGYQVATAASGMEAIAKLHTGFWNLVITDLIMPGVDGFEVLAAAKEINPLTMVIILTGYADLDAAINALRLGADDFLQKPCDTEELLFRMANCFVKQELMFKVRAYENILPVCCYCKKIRDERPGETDRNLWYSLEEYMTRVQGINVSHGCCPECFARHIQSQFPLHNR